MVKFDLLFTNLEHTKPKDSKDCLLVFSVVGAESAFGKDQRSIKTFATIHPFQILTAFSLAAQAL